MRISDWSSDVCSSDLKLYAVIGQARFAQRPRSGCQAGGGEFPIIETVPRPVLSDRRDFDLSFLFRCLLANSEQKPAAPSSQHRLPRFERISREKIDAASLRLAPKILGHMRHDISGILAVCLQKNEKAEQQQAEIGETYSPTGSANDAHAASLTAF